MWNKIVLKGAQLHEQRNPNGLDLILDEQESPERDRAYSEVIALVMSPDMYIHQHTGQGLNHESLDDMYDMIDAHGVKILEPVLSEHDSKWTAIIERLEAQGY